MIERRVEEVLEQGTDILADEIRTKLVPEMANALAIHAKEIRAEHRRLTDPEVSEGVVVAFMGVVDTELDRYVNDELLATIDRLRERLARLSRPDAKLTRREDAQRRFLQHWWILNHRADVGESVLNRPFGVSVEEWPILYFLGEELKKGIKK